MKNEKLSDLEKEQRFKNDTLQRKAMIQLQENEQEIKRLNQVRKIRYDAASICRNHRCKNVQNKIKTTRNVKT